MTGDDDGAALPYRPCVGVVLVNSDGLVFAGERRDVPDAWQMPQGGIDDGEDPLTAALRELEEETSVPSHAVTVLDSTADWLTYDLPPDLLGKVWKGRYRGQTQKWFLLRLDGPDSVIDLATPHPEFSRWQWVDGSELVERIVPFKQDIYRTVIAQFSGYLK